MKTDETRLWGLATTAIGGSAQTLLVARMRKKDVEEEQEV